MKNDQIAESALEIIKETTTESESLPPLKYPSPPSYSLAIDRIQVGKEGVSALPQKHKPFLQLIPLCLWLALRQIHVLYFLLYSASQYFKFCDSNGEIFDTSVEITILIIVILLEIHARYRTYCLYTCNQQDQKNGKFQVWNRATKNWQKIPYEELKAGMIAKIYKYVEYNLRNPINILPISVASSANHILIKTTRLDKRDEFQKIKIMKQLRKLVKKNYHGQIVNFDESIFRATIQYKFKSKFGDTFEAILQMKNNDALISNDDIIPNGIPITTQEYVAGIVLLNCDDINQKNILAIFSKTNQVNTKLGHYILATLLINFFLLMFVFVINLILTQTKTDSRWISINQYCYCSFLNILANVLNTIYISIFLLLYIQRLIDANFLRKKHNIHIKNRIKSIEQFGQTDTLIMDDYFFLDKNLSDDFNYIINPEAPLQSHLHLIIKLIDESPLLKETMYGHTVPICKHFRLKKIKSQILSSSKVKILKELEVNQSCVELKILVTIDETEIKYLLRFNDKPIHSTINKIKSDKFKSQVERLLFQQYHFIMFIEIMKLQNQSLEMSNQYYHLYGIISFKEELSETSLQLVKSKKIKNKFNIVILTNKTWKYINFYLQLAKMKERDDTVIELEEKEEKQMGNILRNHRSTLRNAYKASKSKEKQVILCLNSSMIAYLSRRNIRSSLKKLSFYCKYIVFYNCSQYQKEICAANLFKIFQNHVYLSNYICDFNMFQWSNLSVCEKGGSSEMLTTVVVNKYNDLKTLILKQAIKSIQLTHSVINTHTFKNQLMVISNITAFFLVYRGSTIEISISYLTEIYFFYNFVLTVLPSLYMILRRPEIYIDENKNLKITIKELLKIYAKSCVFGILMALFIYCLLVDQFVTNIFTTIFINCVFTSNIFVLFFDDSIQKVCQVILVMAQIIVSLVVIMILQIFNSTGLKLIAIGTNVDPKNTWFFVTTFLICPLLSFLTIFAFSAGKDLTITNKMEREGDDKEGQMTDLLSQKNTQLVLKVNASKGKQMKFRDEQ